MFLFLGHENAIRDFGVYEFIALPDSAENPRVSECRMK